MIITNEEKQTLQKKYAERIKSLSTNLKQIINDDSQDVLAETIKKIWDACGRINAIDVDYRHDHPEYKLNTTSNEGETNEV